MKKFQTLKTFSLAAIALFQLCFVALSAETGSEQFVYFGTYTGPKSKGIYVSRLNLTTGKLSAPELAADIASPSFLAIHPNHKFLYAVNEVSNFAGKRAGAVTAFSISSDSGKLTFLNQQTSGGDGP